MTKPFVPYKPEKKIKAMITLREAQLLDKLRHYAFGKVTIHKANGVLVRIESSESILLTEKDGEKAVEKLEA